MKTAHAPVIKPRACDAAASRPGTTDLLCVVRHPVGGIATYMRYVYRRLDRSRFRVHVLAASGLEAEAVFPGLGFFDCKFIDMEGIPGLFRIAGGVFRKLVGGKIGLIHSQGATAGAIVSLVNMLWRKPHVITFHETFDDRTLSGRLAPLKREVLSFLFSRANRINLVSEDARCNMLEYFPKLRTREQKIIVIPNGVDIGYLEASDGLGRDLRRDLNIAHGSRVLGFLGRFMPEKGFPVLIDAIAKLVERGRRDVLVVAVGSGAYEREYRALVKERSLENQFRFIPYQSDVRWIFPQLDILVIPSRREAFALVAIEGLVFGRPIVASACIGLREVLAGTPAVLVMPNDPVALADGIEEAIDPLQRDRAESYRVHARKRFDVSVTAQKLAALFEEVLSFPESESLSAAGPRE